jgi:DNA-3-methyladenine glycosylase I
MVGLTEEEVFRCFGTGDPLYERYHDEEWGVPVVGDRAILERLCLEAFQSGLAWITILRKRERFRLAFDGFEPAAVAAYTPADVERLLSDTGIVRNRAKIDATIANARAALRLAAEGSGLSDLVWAHAPEAERPVAPELGHLPAVTPESVALAGRLRSAGFRFLGPTTVYASMQACGVVNDHLAPCPVRERVARLRHDVLVGRSRGLQ